MTPTGRTPSETDIQYLRSLIANEDIVIVSKNGDEIHLDFETYSRADLVHTDLADIEKRIMAIMTEAPAFEKTELRPGPDYLAHDFTKRQRRYRK